MKRPATPTWSCRPRPAELTPADWGCWASHDAAGGCQDAGPSLQLPGPSLLSHEVGTSRQPRWVSLQSLEAGPSLQPPTTAPCPAHPLPPPHSLPRSPLCHATQCLLLDAQVVELNTQCVHQPRSLGYTLFGCQCSASGARCRSSHRRWLRNSETHLWGLMNDCCLGFGRYLAPMCCMHVALPQGPGPTLLWDLKYPLSALRENMFGFWSVLWIRTLNICCSPRGTHAASVVRGEGQMFGAWPALWFRTPNIYCSPWVPIIFKTNSARVAKSTKIKEDCSLW